MFYIDLLPCCHGNDAELSARADDGSTLTIFSSLSFFVMFLVMFLLFTASEFCVLCLVAFFFFFFLVSIAYILV